VLLQRYYVLESARAGPNDAFGVAATKFVAAVPFNLQVWQTALAAKAN
jgi:hypothetical protein